MTSIPYDIDETIIEYRITIPLGGVDPQTIAITYHDENHELIITGIRPKPLINGETKAIHQGCYRGPWTLTIACPPHATGEHTHALTTSNILTILLPKQPTPRSHLILD
ncbi:MAG: hypothetical protein NZL83_01640 [Candidatus Absconditabacterales bacterium]|nr:hypothetical protein [Candidatus Absconditabacterales bacterium]